MTTVVRTNPSIENLKKRAKGLRKAWAAGDAEARARIWATHPRYREVSDEEFTGSEPRLSDCQLVLAREAGFASWPQLKVTWETRSRELPDGFVEIACLCHDDPHYDHRSFHARAHELLRENSWLAEANIWCAATAGDSGAVSRMLQEEPGLANAPGPHGWSALFCACYSRVKPVKSTHSTFAAALALLNGGADPNAYTLKGNADDRLKQKARRFTVLSGVFGGGSTGLANQPPHPWWKELAEALLERGANPADEQALALNQDASLEMLLRFGLQPGAVASDGKSLMGRALVQAVRRANVAQAKLLVEHGARTNETFDGKPIWEHAMRLGHLEIARLLEQAGAPTTGLDELGRFVSACMAGDEREAREMLERSADLVSRAPQNLIHRAVFTRRKEAVKLLIELGFDPNFQEDNAAIMHTGALSERGDILRILIDGGASLRLRDPWYDSTGAGWADFFDCRELRDQLLGERDICLLDALEFGRFDRVGEILANDPGSLERPFAECISREAKPEDWVTPLGRMIERGNADAARVLLEHGANGMARHPTGRSLEEIARERRMEEIARLVGGG